MKSIRWNLRQLSHAKRKLTPAQVDEIRIKRAQGIGPKVLASEYGVNESTVRDIAAGRVWRGVGLDWGQR